jgi:hypothetical protein
LINGIILKGDKMHRITVIENFITAEDAETLIEQQTSDQTERNPYPEYYKDRFGGTSLPYNPIVQDIMIKYGHKSNEIHRALNGFVNPIYVFKAFGSHWTEGSKGGLHIDAQGPEPFIEWSTIMYLNHESEYDGGIIYFPNQNFQYKPKQYSAVFFPSAGTEYIHGISTVTSGHRYTGLYMHTSLPQHADPEFMINKKERWKAGEYELARA